jgi:hypothetical protein
MVGSLGNLDYSNLPADREQEIDIARKSFDVQIIDEDYKYNGKRRYEIGEKLYENLKGVLSEEQLANALRIWTRLALTGLAREIFPRQSFL